MTRIPLVVCAKNEERTLGACLDSLTVAQRYAEERLPLTFERLVVLDDCTDQSAAIARAHGWPIASSSGGKIEAQRVGARVVAPFRVYSDADILVEPPTLHAICQRLLSDERVQVACPPKRPVPPLRQTWLAAALHVYNAHNGFAPPPTWFSGKLFAIRNWSIPTAAELANRARSAPSDSFYGLERGLIADDIFLSRAIVARFGPAAIAHVPTGLVHFRAPESWLGMYRYYRRMRRELERIDRLFPEWRTTHPVRRTDAALLGASSRRERRLLTLFRVALASCRVAYVAERFYHRRRPYQGARRAMADWPPVTESKQPL